MMKISIQALQTWLKLFIYWNRPVKKSCTKVSISTSLPCFHSLNGFQLKFYRSKLVSPPTLRYYFGLQNLSKAAEKTWHLACQTVELVPVKCWRFFTRYWLPQNTDRLFLTNPNLICIQGRPRSCYKFSKSFRSTNILLPLIRLRLFPLPILQLL